VFCFCFVFDGAIVIVTHTKMNHKKRRAHQVLLDHQVDHFLSIIQRADVQVPRDSNGCPSGADLKSP